MIQEPIDQMKKQLELCSDAVIKNTRIITPGDIKQNYLLHIAIKKTNEFIPYHSRIAAHTEDNTLARIHTAPTLGGCIVGFSMSEHLILNSKPEDNKKILESKPKYSSDSPYLGGLYIHKIPFDVALVPNKKLVFDANETNETWLITYSPETRKYPATIIGRIILSHLIVTPRLGKPSTNNNVYIVEITDPDGVYLDTKNFLDKGYWEVSINSNTLETVVTKSSKEVFDENHKLKASLLSYQDPVPFTKW